MTRAFLRSSDVAEHLKIDPRTVRRWQTDTLRSGIARPWFSVGRVVRWYADRLDSWVKDLEAWRTSERERARGKSDGTASTDASEPAPVILTQRRKPSRVKSSALTTLDGSGSLRRRASVIASSR